MNATRMIGHEVKFTTVEGRPTKGTVKGVHQSHLGESVLIEHQVKDNNKIKTHKSWVLVEKVRV